MNDLENSNRFQVDQIDHVELYVPDRNDAALWYRDVLGLEVIPEFQHWADDPRGPLMIGTKQGNTKLALFKGEPIGATKGEPSGPTISGAQEEPKGDQRPVGFHLVAFRVGASSFVQFVALLSRLKLHDQQGELVNRDSVADHGKAFSVYFCDPFGYQFEITTYDYDETKVVLQRSANAS